MTPYTKIPIIEALLDPAATCEWSTLRWDIFLRFARNFNLLAKFAVRAKMAGIVNQLPETVRSQLEAARNVAEHHRRMVEWEVHCLRNILRYHKLDFILLKGAAYIMAGIPSGRGRKVSDIDIMVRKTELGRTEKALLRAGWIHTKHDPYDQRYFREFMHELPPLMHQNRKTLVDVHHNLLPESGRFHPDPKFFWEGAVSIGQEGWLVLSREDMVLHCAAHLYQDGELAYGLRDLFDFEDLVRHFAAYDTKFWENLLSRATLIDLMKPLYYALIYSEEILGTSIPNWVMERASRCVSSQTILALMKYLICRTLVPMTRDAEPCNYRWQKTALYIRAHWLRMPPLLLSQHLSRKAWRSIFPKASQRSRRF